MINNEVAYYTRKVNNAVLIISTIGLFVFQASGIIAYSHLDLSFPVVVAIISMIVSLIPYIKRKFENFIPYFFFYSVIIGEMFGVFFQNARETNPPYSFLTIATTLVLTSLYFNKRFVVSSSIVTNLMLIFLQIIKQVFTFEFFSTSLVLADCVVTVLIN
ncbi:MAG: hypothetical protein WCD89_25220 [Anaerocolumna sp.]